MLKITGKLGSGKLISGTVHTIDFAEAAEAAEKASTDAGSPLTVLTIKTLDASTDGLKVFAPRKRKTAAPAETPVASASVAPKGKR